MEFIRLAEFPLEMDLHPISDLLDSHGIEHRFEREGDREILYVDQSVPVSQIADLVRTAVAGANQPGRPQTFSFQLAQAPVTAILLLLSVIGALLPEFAGPLVHWFTFLDFTQISNTQLLFSSLGETLERGQYWRFITPIFLHFGLFHILFNGLWLWELGRRIEALGRGRHLLMLVLVTGVISNVGQYVWTGPSIFGGMSGVIYGLLGYVWIRNRLCPDPVLDIPPGIIVIMIVWLLVCMSGVTDLLFQISIANAAHAIGLAVGVVFGGFFGILGRMRQA